MLVLAVLSFRCTCIIYMYFDSQDEVQLDKGNPSGSCGCSSSTKDLQELFIILVTITCDMFDSYKIGANLS